MRKKLVCLRACLSGVLLVSSAFGQAGRATAQQVPGTTFAEREVIRLNDLVRLALERNPALQAARRAIDVARSAVSPAGALPDLELMVGQMNEGNVIPFTNLGQLGYSEIYVGFNQEFPYPGKRALKRKVAETEVRAEESRYRLEGLRIISEVKAAFYDLYAVRKSIEIVEKERALLEQLEKIASARYAVGRGAQQDVLDAAVEISRQEERLMLLGQRRESIEALLNTLLYRPLETPIGWPPEIRKDSLTYNLTELSALAEQKFPLLEAQRKEFERDALALDLARKGKLPDFGFTFVYHNRGALADYWTIGGTVKIPLYFNRNQRHEIEGGVAGLERSRHAYQNARAQSFQQVKDLYLKATTAERLLKLYEEAIIRQASFSLESGIASYEVGKIDFLTLLTSWTRVLDYELAYNEQLAEYQKALSQLEPLVGTELARAGGN